jgi:hypothetical protein
MKKFTNNQLLIKDKQFRVMIFGKLDKNKNHSIIINNTIIPIWDLIRSEFHGQLLAMEGDEIVLSSFDHKKELDKLNSLNLPNIVRVSCFILNSLLIPSNKNLEKLTCNQVFSRTFIHHENNKLFDIKCANKFELKNAYKSYKDTHEKVEK